MAHAHLRGNDAGFHCGLCGVPHSERSLHTVRRTQYSIRTFGVVAASFVF